MQVNTAELAAYAALTVDDLSAALTVDDLSAALTVDDLSAFCLSSAILTPLVGLYFLFLWLRFIFSIFFFRDHFYCNSMKYMDL